MSVIHLCIPEYEMRTMTNTLGLAPLRKFLNYSVVRPRLKPQMMAENSHTPREITIRALRYFDKRFFWWSNLQKRSVCALNAFFAQEDVREDFGDVRTRDVERCIKHIGRVFFIRGFSNVRFRWLDEEEEEEQPSIVGQTMRKGANYQIMINRKSNKCMSTRLEKTWKLARRVLLHEACHLVFTRFQKDDWNLMADDEVLDHDGQLPGHHAAWQVLAKAVEDRADSELGWKIDISRMNGLRNDFRRNRDLGMTRLELKHCFGDKIDFSGSQYDEKCMGFKWKQKLVYREGISYFLARVRTKISKPFAALYAKVRGREE